MGLESRFQVPGVGREEGKEGKLAGRWMTAYGQPTATTGHFPKDRFQGQPTTPTMALGKCPQGPSSPKSKSVKILSRRPQPQRCFLGPPPGVEVGVLSGVTFQIQPPRSHHRASDDDWSGVRALGTGKH